MTRVNVDEVKKKAKLFLENKTFTFIIEWSSDGKVRYYNGYILDVKDDFLVLQDRKIPNPIPIPLDFISKIDVSENTPGGKKDGEN